MPYHTIHLKVVQYHVNRVDLYCIEDGKDNLAPYSQYQNLTWDPPMVMFAANQSVLGDERKDTVKMQKRQGGLYGTWPRMI